MKEDDSITLESLKDYELKELTVTDVTNTLDLSKTLSEELMLVFACANKQNLYIHDLDDVKAMCRYCIDNIDVFKLNYPFSLKNLSSLLRKTAVYEARDELQKHILW